MNLLAPVSHIMSSDLIKVLPEDSLEQVENIFNEHRIHHILVTKNEKLKGIISKSDFLFFKRGFSQNENDSDYNIMRLRVHKVEEIMTTKMATLQHNQRIGIALAIFKENLFHAIPILDEDKTVGIVTTHDFIKHLYNDQDVTKEYIDE